MTKFKYKLGDKVRILDGSSIEDYTGSWTTGVWILGIRRGARA